MREREYLVDSSIFLMVPWLWCIIIFVYIVRFVVIRLWCSHMFLAVLRLLVYLLDLKTEKKNMQWGTANSVFWFGLVGTDNWMKEH